MIITTTKPMRKRAENDVYPTPMPLARAALALFHDWYPQRILDPGCGDGVWACAAYEKWQHYQPTIHGVELHPTRRVLPGVGIIEADYLTWQAPSDYQFIIGNPPYKLAEQFIHKSLSLLAPNGQMILLLRLAFLEGQRRRDSLWNLGHLRRVYVLSQRPSFIAEGEKAGKTDATAYGIYLFVKRAAPNVTPELSWLTWR